MKAIIYKTFFLLTLFGLFIPLYLSAQQIPPPKLWDKTLGGDSTEVLNSMINTSDGGFLLGGWSKSGKNGDKSGNNKGKSDYWLIKIDANGDKLWDKIFGGNSNDELTSILATPDGGFLLGGYSQSLKGGDKSEDSNNYDYWLIKIDAQGNKLWDRTFGGDDHDFLNSMLITSDGGFLLGGYTYSNKMGYNENLFDFFIVKIDNQGNKLWDKTYGQPTQADILTSMLTTSDNGFLLGGRRESSWQNDYWLIKIDGNGNQIWDKILGGNVDDYLASMLVTSDSGFLLGGYSQSDKNGDKSEDGNGSNDYWIIKLDAQGNKLWDKTFGGDDDEVLSSMLANPDGSFLLGGYSKSDKNSDKSENSKGVTDYWLVKIDALGNKLWDRTLGGEFFDILNTMLATSDDGILLGGYSESNKGGDKSENARGGISVGIPESDYWIIKLGKEATNRISGNIFQTSESNCLQTTNRPPLIGWTIQAKSNTNTYYSLTDSLGHYTLLLDKDTYIVSQIPPSNGILKVNNQNCPIQPYQITFNRYGKDTTGFNFGLDVAQCAVLKVDVSSAMRRRCFLGQTTISYRNEGIGKAENVQLEVDFPEFVIPLKSSTPWNSKKGKTLIFNLGTLQAGEQKRIIISDSVTCVEQARGMSQCVEARISPKNSCIAPNPNWNGANLELRGKCFLLTEPIAQIVLKNTGKANMNNASNYRIFANDSLLLASTMQLIAGDSLLLEFPTQGLSIRVEAEQVPLHPNPDLLSVNVEGCSLVNNQKPQNQGFVNRFIQADANLETEIDCQVVRDSFDPNDKLVSPEGITEKHYVKPDTRLEYTLRFQNTGTAEAINIQVIDTLSSDLNFETFEIMSASHSYQLEVRGSQKQVLIFKFPNINLPDSTSNEPQSHGFIKFKISPKANLAVGTIVKNFADIYFDYNEPVRTNVTEINYTDYQFPIVKTLNPCVDFKNYAPKKPIISQINNENKLICDVKEATYQWYRNGALISQNTQTIEINQSGDYEVIVSKNACVSEKSVKLSLDICKTDAFFLKKPIISQNPNENKLKADISEATYQWFRNGVLMSQNTQTIDLNQSGEYEVIVSKNACVSEKSAKFSFVVTALSEFEKQAQISIYPNPSQGNLNLKMANTLTKELKVSVLHSSGKVVWQKCFQTDTQTNWETSLDLNHLPQGLYFLEIENSKGKSVKKIIVER